MWTWVYGIFISMYMLIHELSTNVFLRVLPLWIACVAGLVAVVYQYSQATKLHYTVYVTSIGASVALLTTLRETGIIENVTYFIAWLNIVVVAVTVVYLVQSGWLLETSYMNDGDKCLYYSSLLLSVVTYSLFYGVEYEAIEPWIPLLIFFALLIVEGFIIKRLYTGTEFTRDEFNREKAADRMNYVVCIFILYVCAVARYIWNLTDVFLYTAALIAYTVGGMRIVYIERESMWDMTCFGFNRHKLLTSKEEPEIL